MDLDRDGHVDLLSGSYLPGEVFLFRGRDGGSFAAPEGLRRTDGAELLVGRASWPFACDWDGDGDLDLVLGNMYGKVFWAARAEGGAALAFEAPVPLVAGGHELDVGRTNAAPHVVDWDGDGAQDLLLGTGDGSVRFYRNLGEPRGARGVPRLAEGLELLPKSPSGELALRLAHPGPRARVAAFDWNADGRLDLVVGEHLGEDGPAPVLSPADQRTLAEAQRESFALSERRGTLEREAFTRWLAREKIPPTRASEHHDRFLAEWLETEEARALTARTDELAALQARLSAPTLEHGRLWVFLRRKNEPLAR